MSQKERTRLVILSRVSEKTMTIREASEVIGVSYRQGRRIYKRYQEEGEFGLVHRNRGYPSNRRKPAEVKGDVLRIYKKDILFLVGSDGSLRIARVRKSDLTRRGSH